MTRFIPGTSLWVSSLHLSDVQHVADLISKPLHCKSLSFCWCFFTYSLWKDLFPRGLQEQAAERIEHFTLSAGVGFNALLGSNLARTTTCFRSSVTWLCCLPHRVGVRAGRVCLCFCKCKKAHCSQSSVSPLHSSFDVQGFSSQTHSWLKGFYSIWVFFNTLISSAQSKNVPLL